MVLARHEQLQVLVHAEGGVSIEDPMGVLDGRVGDVLEASVHEARSGIDGQPPGRPVEQGEARHVLRASTSPTRCVGTRVTILMVPPRPYEPYRLDEAPRRAAPVTRRRAQGDPDLVPP